LFLNGKSGSPEIVFLKPAESFAKDRI